MIVLPFLTESNSDKSGTVTPGIVARHYFIVCYNNRSTRKSENPLKTGLMKW